MLSSRRVIDLISSSDRAGKPNASCPRFAKAELTPAILIAASASLRLRCASFSASRNCSCCAFRSRCFARRLLSSCADCFPPAVPANLRINASLASGSREMLMNHSASFGMSSNFLKNVSFNVINSAERTFWSPANRSASLRAVVSNLSASSCN